MWRAAIIAWSVFQDEEHLSYFRPLRWLDEQRSQELYDKAKELLLNDAYHQTSSTSGPFSRPSFVAAVKAVIEEGARRSSPRSGNNKAANSLLSQNADDNNVPVISLDRLGVFSF
ncbi:hypothetical protein CEUSTIGMA_g7679.t1 [Chlamydomonas eustigma]|uniref:Uncharacterized protein n=1 Tax=Chlamydomonas eustigma TaxID=1157962 RepID=A0A250XAY2_9CHLO|nr:hypothetical protein CEUSTIGMA_g7679.t1 [Chlamydomonas eustigma]|eukprot:GAX80241.1 hypothetical protein CEUSTIGMA_g7679.t1 [Chlamydomonas eustigma]